MTISLEQVEREIKRINLEITRLQGESRQVRDRTNYLAGGSGNFVPGGGGATPLPSHNIIGVKHFGVGSALDVIGFSASNTLGVLSPSSNPGAAASLLKTDASGFLTLTGLTLNGNLTVTGTVDGVDVSAHVADVNAHHSQAHVLATTTALGPDHTVSGLTLGQVFRATGATTAAFGSLIEGDLPVHDIISKHSASGLTIGHVIRASGATTFLFAQLQHSDLGGVGTDDHHAQVHNVTGADHTIVASAFQLVGATATNTLGLLTPSSDPAISEAILKTNPAGRVTLQDITIRSGGKVSGEAAPTTDFFKPGSQIASGSNFVIALDVDNNQTGRELAIGHNDFLPGDPNWSYLFVVGETITRVYNQFQVRNGGPFVMQSGDGTGETGRWNGATGDISLAGDVYNLIDTDQLGLSGGNLLSSGANIHLFGGTHATLANHAYYDADLHTFRSQAAATKFIIDHASNYSRFFHSVGIGGIPSASTILELASTTGALLVPRMNSTQRDALTATNGMILFNTTTTKLQVYAGAWTDLH